MASPFVRLQRNASIAKIAQPLRWIEEARKGDSYYMDCHPDYAQNLEERSTVGNFPNNIDRVLWVHVGFTGSLQGIPREACDAFTETYAMILLKNGAKVFLHAGHRRGFPYIDLVISKHYAPLLDSMLPRVFATYRAETEWVNLLQEGAAAPPSPHLYEKDEEAGFFVAKGPPRPSPVLGPICP